MNAPTPSIVAERLALPANVEIEQGLLGAIILDNSMLHSVSRFLKAEHFFEPIHQAIYEVAKRLADEGRRITPATLINHLPAETMLVPGLDIKGYVARLAAESAGPLLARDFGRTIFELAVRRELVAVGEDIGARALEDGFNVTAQIGDAVERLSILTASTNREHQRQSTAGAAAGHILERINNGEVAEPPLSTGLADLDRVIGGLRRGTLDILAGRPGMMKTTLAGTLALNVAKAPTEIRPGVGVLFFSMEMTKEQFVARLLTDIAYRQSDPLTYEAILDGGVPAAHHRALLTHATARLNELPLIIDPQPGLSMAEIAARTRRVAEAMERRGVKLGLVVADHLGKVRTPRGREGRNIELGDVTASAAELAKEADACFVLLCQLNRQVESRDNKRPTLSDLRESGHIEEDADVVFGLYRESYYLTKQVESDAEKELGRAAKLEQCQHDLEVLVLKNRHGAEGYAKLWVHAGSAAIRDREYRP